MNDAVGQSTWGKVLDGNGDLMLYKPKTLTDSRKSACHFQSLHVSDQGRKSRLAGKISQIKVQFVDNHLG